MKYIATLTMFLSLLAAQAADWSMINSNHNWYYQSTGGTNTPPLPDNIRPGYEAVPCAGGWLVLDRATDLVKN